MKDINFEYKQVIVREAKGNKDRIATLSEKIIPEFKVHFNKVFVQHKNDLKKEREELSCLLHLQKSTRMPILDMDLQIPRVISQFL